jgi:hypothetical protein
MKMSIVIYWAVTLCGIHPEDGSDMFLRNSGNNTLDHGVITQQITIDVLSVFEDRVEDIWIEEKGVSKE